MIVQDHPLPHSDTGRHVPWTSGLLDLPEQHQVFASPICIVLLSGEFNF